MKLWTYHARTFSLLEGQLDPAKSPQNASISGLLAAKRDLARQIGTNQFNWCFTNPDQWDMSFGMEVEWILDVPPSAILRFIDVIVWHRILKTSYVPREKQREWSYEALGLHPGGDNLHARQQYERRQREAYLAEPEPSGGWWSSLFVEPQVGDHVHVLIPHPVRPDWVVVNPLNENADP